MHELKNQFSFIINPTVKFTKYFFYCFPALQPQILRDPDHLPSKTKNIPGEPAHIPSDPKRAGSRRLAWFGFLDVLSSVGDDPTEDIPANAWLTAFVMIETKVQDGSYQVI
jgi:hypothetical protein